MRAATKTKGSINAQHGLLERNHSLRGGAALTLVWVTIISQVITAEIGADQSQTPLNTLFIRYGMLQARRKEESGHFFNGHLFQARLGLLNLEDQLPFLT